MAGKRDNNQEYAVHGTGVDSLGHGFDELGMPEHRRDTARAIVRELLEANDATEFYWYKPPATEELCCYWDDAPRNLLWINTGALHFPNDISLVVKPPRPLTYFRDGGDYVGWLLPGAESGTGGGPRQAQVPTVLCPDTFIHVPVGTPCPYCEIEHHT